MPCSWRSFSPPQVRGLNKVRSPLPQNQEAFRTCGLDPISDRTNRDTRTYSCPFCPFKRVFKTTVKRHILLKHTTERPFSCTLCPLRFGTKSNLKRHMLVHTGEKPYQCPRCFVKFAQKINLQIHLTKKTLCSKSWKSFFTLLIIRDFKLYDKLYWFILFIW